MRAFAREQSVAGWKHPVDTSCGKNNNIEHFVCSNHHAKGSSRNRSDKICIQNTKNTIRNILNIFLGPDFILFLAVKQSGGLL